MRGGPGWRVTTVCCRSRLAEIRDGPGRKENGPPRQDPCGPWPVQLRFPTGLTSEEYVRTTAWEQARLDRCPLHPRGGCGFCRHGTYERQEPPGARIARYYCRQGHQSFSLLPDCLAARMSSTLAEVEQVVATAQQAKSLWAAADKLRPDISLPSAVRWVSRRVAAVRVALVFVVGLAADRLVGVQPRLDEVGRALGTREVLVAVRGICAAQLQTLVAPVGFHPRRGRRSSARYRPQHKTGPDPPG